MIHVSEVLAPFLIDDPQHHLSLDLSQHLLAELVLALRVQTECLIEQEILEFLEGVGGLEADDAGFAGPE